MDLPLAGAVLLLGASLGSSLFGNPGPKPVTPPCVCHCECIAEGAPHPGLSCNFIGICLLLLVVAAPGIALVWLRGTLVPNPNWGQTADSSSEVSKGKGKKGVLRQVALTLKQ